MVIKDYIWKHKIVLLPLAIIYAFIVVIFFWSLDSRIPIDSVLHKLSVVELVQGQYLLENITVHKDRDCKGTLHRKFVSLERDEISIYHLDETPFTYPANLKGKNTISFNESLIVPPDIPSGFWNYEVEIEFECNPIRTVTYHMDPIKVVIKG